MLYHETPVVPVFPKHLEIKPKLFDVVKLLLGTKARPPNSFHFPQVEPESPEDSAIGINNEKVWYPVSQPFTWLAIAQIILARWAIL